MKHNLYGQFYFPYGLHYPNYVHLHCASYRQTHDRLHWTTQHIVTVIIFKHCALMKRETVSALKIFVGNTRGILFTFPNMRFKMIRLYLLTLSHHITFKRNATALENSRPAWSDTDNNRKKIFSYASDAYTLLLYIIFCEQEHLKNNYTAVNHIFCFLNIIRSYTHNEILKVSSI